MPSLENFLTNKEKARVRKRMEILRLLKSGLTVREVARRLKVSTATVIKIKKYFTPHQNSGVGFSERKQKIKSGENFDLSSKISARRWIWG